MVNALVTQVWDYIPASPRAAATLEKATHTSKAALRPGTRAVVKISAGLECGPVSPQGLVVVPGSASF